MPRNRCMVTGEEIDIRIAIYTKGWVQLTDKPLIFMEEIRPAFTYLSSEPFKLHVEHTGVADCAKLWVGNRDMVFEVRSVMEEVTPCYQNGIYIPSKYLNTGDTITLMSIRIVDTVAECIHNLEGWTLIRV